MHEPGLSPPRAARRVAVMQPYFFPYAGYFRLFAAADEFVLFDCVQFPRRGRVHRTELADAGGTPAWLTLPLANQPRDTRIASLEFAANARQLLDSRLAALPWLRAGQGAGARQVRDYLQSPLVNVVDFLEAGLRLVAGTLGIEPRIVRSSSLDIDPGLRGQDRVVAVARAVGASSYLNSPGGTALYDHAEFARHGISLEFLPPYGGRFFHMLPALVNEDPATLRADVLSTIAPSGVAGDRPPHP